MDGSAKRTNSPTLGKGLALGLVERPLVWAAREAGSRTSMARRVMRVLTTFSLNRVIDRDRCGSICRTMRLPAWEQACGDSGTDLPLFRRRGPRNERAARWCGRLYP